VTTLAGIRSIRNLNLANQRVFIRVDFNVPLKKGTTEITDDTRIREALETIRYAVEAEARVILASHLGRPKPGKTEGLSLEPCGKRLAELTGYEVHLPEDCIGDAAKKVVYDLRPGQICLLENLRFHEEEEKNDEGFAKQLAELCDVYIDDAFGAVHRAHASVHALPRLMRERGCGFLLEKEINALSKLVSGPDKPYVAVLGGAKVSDKLKVIESLLERIDVLLIGGAMANTFLAAQGKNMQRSKIEDDKLALARTLLEKAQTRGTKVVLPTDAVVASDLQASEGRVVDVNAIPEGTMALDIGPATLALFSEHLHKAETVFWNGPMGLFEIDAFSHGTMGIAQAIADLNAFTVVGGGDSAAAVQAAGEKIAKRFSHISTGGGAALELLEGATLPGVEALRQ